MQNRRRYERVEAVIRVKLPGETQWTECTNANVSAGGMLFDTLKLMNEGDFVTLQFMLHAEAGTMANLHFFASAKVVRIIPNGQKYDVGVEFIIDEAVRKEILRVVEMIKSANLKVDRPTAIDAVLHKDKRE